MQVPVRIQKIIDMCTNVDTIADIGTDHGLTACGLLLQKKARRVIATDISELSLQKARALSSELSLTNKMDFRIGDGLTPINASEVQGIVLSGMGAPLIIGILEKSKKVVKAADYVVICAHSYPERIRAFCQENGHFIEKEEVVLENDHYYIIMRIIASEKSEVYTKGELLTGKNMVRSAAYLQYLQQQMQTYAQIRKQAAKASDNARYHEIDRALRVYEDAYKAEGGKQK